MTLHRRPLVLAAVVASVLIGCGSTATPRVEQVDVTGMEEYGCGYGFWLGSADERVAVRLVAATELVEEGALPQEVVLPDTAWDATVLIGEDLYANWCDDVLDPGESEPVIAEQWPITAGTITLQEPSSPAAVCPTEVRGRVSGLEATRPDGTVVELGGRELRNETWGCFAG